MTDGTMRWGEVPPSMGDVARTFIARGLDDAHRHRAIPAKVAAVFARRMGESPNLENAFRCEWDAAAEALTSAVWLCRGTEAEVRFVTEELRPFTVVVHNHPGTTGEPLLPSQVDIDTAAGLAVKSIGYAIISNDQSQFLLVQPPRASGVVADRKVWDLGPASWGFTFSRTTIRRVLP